MNMRIVYLSCHSLTLLEVESGDKVPNESGGILVGRFDGDRLYIPEIVGPGPEAYHAPSAFRRDGAFAQRELDRLYEESEGTLDYVGEWHSHMMPGGPSLRDSKSMRWIANNPRYALPTPVLIIMQRTGTDEWRPVAFQWRKGRLRAVTVAAGSIGQAPFEAEWVTKR